jgi:hypothetical protein
MLWVMKNRRFFKLKTFSRWAKKILTDAQLRAAAQEILNGQFEADLGGGVCKKRIAIAGKGKSGSTRTLVAKSSPIGVFSWQVDQKMIQVQIFPLLLSLRP